MYTAIYLWPAAPPTRSIRRASEPRASSFGVWPYSGLSVAPETENTIFEAALWLRRQNGKQETEKSTRGAKAVKRWSGKTGNGRNRRDNHAKTWAVTYSPLLGSEARVPTHSPLRSRQRFVIILIPIASREIFLSHIYIYIYMYMCIYIHTYRYRGWLSQDVVHRERQRLPPLTMVL